MFQRILGLILLAATALTQINEIKPDISFPDHNNRFDLSGMVSAQNKMIHNIPLADDDEEDAEASEAYYRRDLQNEDTGILTHASKSKDTSQAFLTRREEPDFAYDPDNLPSIGRAGDDDMLDLEYQENLNQFKINIPKPSRRNAPTEEQKREDDVLMQNVVPIELTVDGYLKAPLKEIL